MKSRFIPIITLCILSAPLVVTSPVSFAAYFTSEEHAEEEAQLLEETGKGKTLFTEESPFQNLEFEFDSTPTLAIIYSQLQAKEFAKALESAQQLRKTEQDSPDLLALMGIAYSGLGQNEQAENAFKMTLEMNPGNPNAASYLARMAIQAGNFDAADAYYRQILKYHPNHKPTLLMQEKLSIRKQFQAQDFAAALKTATQLNHAQPDQPDPLVLMGIAYIGKEDRDQAKNAFQQALQLQPGNPKAALNLALLSIQSGDLNKARNYYQQILEYHPDYQSALLGLANLEARQGNNDVALAFLKKAVQQNPEAMEPLVAMARFQLNSGNVQQALTILNTIPPQYADQPLLLETLGETQLTAKNWTDALATLQKWVKLQPKSAQAHYLVSAAYLANKDRKAAKSALIKGLKLNPDLLAASELMTLMVSTEASLKDKDKLVLALKKTQPEHPQVMDLEAQLALTHGDAKNAVVIYQKLQQRYPDNSAWVKTLARAQWQAGEKENSLTTLNTWLLRHADDTNIRYMQASAYMQLNKENEAKAALTQIVEQSPDYVPALNNLAWLLRDDNPKRALAYAEHAHQLSPNNPAVMDTLGVLLLQQGDKVKALELLAEAQTLNPNNSSIAYHYAKALTKNGKQEQAQKILNDLLNKPFPEQQQAQLLFQSLQ